MEVQSLTPESKARIAKMISLAVHSLSIVNALSSKNAQVATNQAYNFLIDQCPKLYPSVIAGVADLQSLAKELGIDIDIVAIPNTGEPSPYMN